MSVLGTISLSGLTTTNSDYIYANQIEITGNLTLDPGSTLTLQPNSISDTALSTNVAFLNKFQTFTNSNTFSNSLTLDNGLISSGIVSIKRGPGDAALQFQDTTSLNTNTFSINGTTASYSMSGVSSGHSFFVRTGIGATSNVLSLTNSQVTVTSTNMINTTASDAVVTDNTGKLATTRWVTSKQTNFLTLANTWTNQNTFSRTAGNINLRCLDSSNSTFCSFAMNNNQINLNMPQNDSRFIFNTLSPLGVANDTFTINQTTSSLNCTNPLVQSATMPASNDSSTKTPTTAWVQGAITNFSSSLLSSVNTWTALNTFSRTSGNISLRLLDSSTGGEFTGAVGNNQINLIMSKNDSKIYFQTNTLGGVQTDTLLLNSTTSSFNCTNPLVQTATMPASNDSSTKTPTTAWVQSALTSSISSYNSSLLSANNTWTGTNQFNNQVTCQRSGVDIPLFISSSSQTNYKGCNFISSSAGNYNPIVQANEYVIFGYNPTGLDLSTLTLTTHSTTSSGIKITNNLTKVFGANEFDTKIKTSRTSAPSAQCIGDIYKVQCVSGIITNFFLSTWNGTTNISLYSYTFDDSTDNKRYGTYLVKVALNYENSVATTALCCNVNTINATDNLSANMQTVGTGNTMLVGGNYQYNINFSFVEQVYSTKTFYMNVTRTTSGVGGFTNTSYISWTRIA